MIKRALFVSLAVLALVPGCSSAGLLRPRILFDDFNYTRPEELEQHGWIIRTEPGFPGVPGSAWGREGLSLIDDPARSGNRILRMTSSTDGGANTRQNQICHQRKYLEGTYAARVRFTDAPVAGPNGDNVVETLYMISPLEAPMDLDYSETDFEYLPNGGWNHTGPTISATTWETFNLEPWKADNVSSNNAGALAGWHTLVAQIAAGRVRYYVDGRMLADHGDRFYPESMMSINFNLWFIRNGLIPGNSELRRWEEDVDWVFHRAGAVLAPDEVEAAVAGMRRKSVRFRDTVPPRGLSSPCNF